MAALYQILVSDSGKGLGLIGFCLRAHYDLSQRRAEGFFFPIKNSQEAKWGFLYLSYHLSQIQRVNHLHLCGTLLSAADAKIRFLEG